MINTSFHQIFAALFCLWSTHQRLWSLLPEQLTLVQRPQSMEMPDEILHVHSSKSKPFTPNYNQQPHIQLLIILSSSYSAGMKKCLSRDCLRSGMVEVMKTTAKFFSCSMHYTAHTPFEFYATAHTSQVKRNRKSLHLQEVVNSLSVLSSTLKFNFLLHQTNKLLAYLPQFVCLLCITGFLGELILK